MSTVNVLIQWLQTLYEGFIGFIEQLGPPILVALLTAVVTVQLTFWYHERRDRRNALNAFLSELHLNDMETEMMIHDIFSHRDGYEFTQNTRTTVELAMSGYDTMKTTGTLAAMSQRANESIRSYYTMVRLINRCIQKRQDILYNLSYSEREEAIESIDEELFTYICTISGPGRLELVADRLQGNDVAEEELREYYERKSGREADGPIFGDYEEVERHVYEELESLQILPRWSEIRRQTAKISPIQ